jgi:hypothetical protein
LGETVLEDIKETLIKGLFSTTYESRLFELKNKLDDEDKKYMLLLEGESDSYAVLLTKYFPDIDIEKIMVEAIVKANHEMCSGIVNENYRLAA